MTLIKAIMTYLTNFALPMVSPKFKQTAMLFPKHSIVKQELSRLANTSHANKIGEKTKNSSYSIFALMSNLRWYFLLVY